MASRTSGVSLAVFSTLALYSSFGWSQELQTDRKDPVVECRKLIKSPDGYQEFEAFCLPSLAGIVEKIDNAIRVKLRDGTTKSFKISKACSNGDADKECILYYVGNYFSKNDLVVIERWLDIGPSAFRTGSYMIDRGSGRVIDLPGPAHFSPDGNRFISLSVCYDHCPNRIDLWSVKDDPAKLDWRHRVKQGEDSYYYEFLGWQNNERANLRIYPEKPAEGDAGRDIDKDKYSDARVYFDGLGWKIEKFNPGNQTQGPGRVEKLKN